MSGEPALPAPVEGAPADSPPVDTLPVEVGPAEARPPRRVPTWLLTALLPLQSVLLAILVSWPLLPRLTTAAVGSPDTDTPKHLWTLWWMRREFWSGDWGLHTTWANYPDGLELFPISPLDGLLYALLPVSVPTAANLLALLHLVLLGLCAGWLGREVAGTRLGALVAGALAQGSAFVGFSLEVGVGELRLYWWVPLGLACLVRAHHTRDRRWFLTLGAVLAGAVISCFYHGLFLATAVATWALATLRPDRRLLVGYAMAAALAVAVVVPTVRTFATTYGEAAEEVPAQRLLLPGAAVSPEELWTPRDLVAEARGAPRSAYEAGRYLGLVALLLGGLGVVAQPRRAAPWVAVFGVTALLSLGSVLTWHGERVVTGGRGFVLPMAWLNTLLAQVGEPINFPARFIAASTIALAVLGALATRWRWTAVLVPLALADVLAHDRAAWPRATAPLAPMDGFEAAALPAPADAPRAVADLSMVASQGEPSVRNRSIAAQITLDRPFAGVPIERLSTWANSADRWLGAVPLVRAITRVEHTGAAIPAGDWRADLWLLRERGYGSLLLTHRRGTPDVRADTLLTQLCGVPVRAPNATLWTLPAVTASAEEAATWTAAQELRIVAERPPDLP